MTFTVKFLSFNENADKSIDAVFELSNGASSFQRTIKQINNLIDFNDLDALEIFARKFIQHLRQRNKILSVLNNNIGKIIYQSS